MIVETSIPLIDFAPFLSNDQASQQRLAAEIFRACHEVGFIYLTNHGIPQPSIERAFEQSRRFFNLPLAKKQEIAWSSEASNRGYVGIERERLDENQPGDLKEAFNVGKEISPAEAEVRGAALVQNRWPEEEPEFQAAISEFFEVCATGAARVFRAFA
ncbi:isopenicillin N synthase family oxygenase, partial [filamentous cyanobacterium CCP5]